MPRYFSITFQRIKMASKVPRPRHETKGHCIGVNLSSYNFSNYTFLYFHYLSQKRQTSINRSQQCNVFIYIVADGVRQTPIMLHFTFVATQFTRCVLVMILFLAPARIISTFKPHGLVTFPSFISSGSVVTMSVVILIGGPWNGGSPDKVLLTQGNSI